MFQQRSDKIIYFESRNLHSQRSATRVSEVLLTLSASDPFIAGLQNYHPGVREHLLTGFEIPLATAGPSVDGRPSTDGPAGASAISKVYVYLNMAFPIDK